jgi:hypothetical protein
MTIPIITATSTIIHNSTTKTFPGLLLLRTETVPKSGYRNSFVVNTVSGTLLIVADLNNPYFPLNWEMVILESGVCLIVYDFALFLQKSRSPKIQKPHLFLTSQNRLLYPKFDPTPGELVVGECCRTVNGTHDLFVFDEPLSTASQS